MTAPPPADRSRSLPRWAARLSIMAAFACCTINCVFGMLTSKVPVEQTRLANVIVGSLSLAVVVVGILAGGYAALCSLKRQDRDTLVMAAVGLVLNVGIVFTMLWLLYLIRNAAA